MKITFTNDEITTEKELQEFLEKSSPITPDDFNFIEGEEDAGWVDFVFKCNDEKIKLTLSLAEFDLSEFVCFFENLINLKEETAVFLYDEYWGNPLLYANPIDDSKIRFLLADNNRMGGLFQNYKIDEEDLNGIFDYDIKIDVIIDKNTVLKGFYSSINNIITKFKPEYPFIYDIGYENWKNNLDNICSYLNDTHLL